MSAGRTRVGLVVEDELLIRMEIADALEDAGWEVVERSTGEEALQYLAAREVDLIVTDIRLAGRITGWDVAEECRSRYPDSGIIYCSGTPAVEERCVSGSVFLSKPIDMYSFLGTVGHLCAP